MRYDKSAFETAKYLYEIEIEKKNEIEKNKQFYLSMCFAITTLVSYLYKVMVSDQYGVKTNKVLFLIFMVVFSYKFTKYIISLNKLYLSEGYSYLDPKEFKRINEEIITHYEYVYEYEKSKYSEKAFKSDVNMELVYQTTRSFLEFAQTNQINNEKKCDELLIVKKNLIHTLVIVLVEISIMSFIKILFWYLGGYNMEDKKKNEKAKEKPEIRPMAPKQINEQTNPKFNNKK